MDIKINIMLVEDDAVLAEEIALFLKKWGYATTVIREFKDILSAFMRCRPQLVLMDINLPYYDGFYWCRRIREISEIPLIYISSRSDDNDKIMDRIYLREDICFEQDTASLLLHGQEIELTKSEKRIMAKLIEHRPGVITREDLMMTLWSTDEFVSDGTLTTLVSRLRSKLSG